ncbi:MAG: MOSC domain-containing protein [Synergistaceae bacterium]|nr:MOSC domain-containing protein [Synergistaceae bacterium]
MRFRKRGKRLVNRGRVVAVCRSDRKGIPKEDIRTGRLLEELGLEGDAHAGFAHRQVSLIAMEDIRQAQEKLPELRPGSFAENLTVEGIDLGESRVGRRIRVGKTLLEITQIGKECHTKCAIYRTSGDCIMPKKGIFCRVIQGGIVSAGDPVEWE